MSKFIRTKYGIYEVESEYLDNDGKWIGYNIVGNDIAIILRTQVIKEADTVEELCDGFYNDILGDGAFNFDGLYIYNDFESFKGDWKAYRIYDDWEGNGYGFIKTGKGLIYVAKMNDKGEFELL